MEKLKRYLVFLVGLFINSLGVSLVTKANLGTSPISILFGYFIDLTMMLLFFVHTQSYIVSVIYLLMGCLILGFGVYTEVLAHVAMLPGESFVRAVSSTWKTEFDSTKVAFDVSPALIAAALSSSLPTVLTVSGREPSLLPSCKTKF